MCSINKIRLGQKSVQIHKLAYPIVDIKVLITDFFAPVFARKNFISRALYSEAKLLPETDFHAKVLRAKLLRGTDN
ncbi:MAG: hypothetical protein DRR16_13155 [Candidatus Parabeggiatoa sp. nov. 3]|nr:MAG: hypothetical protein DRQ99_16060 [Gammaproteobacteria bacterium]RKZ84995.1 MAG: hypothetical protein DRR16_13155 [Gammaproteobacteria bacterium]